MKITKSGFYKLSELDSKEIIVGDNLAVTFFDDINSSINLSIGENSNVEFFGYSSGIIDGENKAINILQEKQGSKIHFRYLIYSEETNKNKITVSSQISNNKVSSDIKILSIAGNSGSIDLDGIIKINSGVSGVKGKLIEENLFLGSSGSIKGIPTLLVESSDVEASHACKIERISDEKLFYLRSRGIGKENAMKMMIEAKIIDLFKCLGMINKDFYEEIIEAILEQIK